MISNITCRRLGMVMSFALVGCAASSRAPLEVTSVQEMTHVEKEVLARLRGDLSSTDSRVFNLARRQLVKPNWSLILDLEFEGKNRRDAKTSYAVKGSKLIPFESFDSVGELIEDLNANSPDDQVKKAYQGKRVGNTS